MSYKMEKLRFLVRSTGSVIISTILVILMSMLGYASGRHHDHGGGGTNQLCLPEEPQWKDHGCDPPSGWLYGIEYRTHQIHDAFFSGDNNGCSNKFHGMPTPCAVCHMPQRSASVMIPIRTSCPDGWTQDYTGYLMSEHSYTIKDKVRHTSNWICMDGVPEISTGGVRYAQDQAVLTVVKVGCGTLPCSKYNDGWELPCVVCSK